MATTRKRLLSGYLSLNQRDIVRSLLMVAIGSTLYTAYEVVEMWINSEPFTKADVWASLKAGIVSGGGANLVKQLFTDGKIVKEKVIDERR